MAAREFAEKEFKQQRDIFRREDLFNFQNLKYLLTYIF